MMRSNNIPVRRRHTFRFVPLFSACALIFCCQILAFPQSDDRSDAVAIFNRAQDLHEKGDLNGAVELYKGALKVIPEFPEAEYQCGVAHLGLNEGAAAESSF